MVTVCCKRCCKSVFAADNSHFSFVSCSTDAWRSQNITKGHLIIIIIITIIIVIVIIIIIMLAPPTWNCPCSSLTRASWFWISNFSRVIRCRS